MSLKKILLQKSNSVRTTILGVAAILSTSSVQVGADQTKEISIGATVALTGKYAKAGQEQLNGYQVWVDEINQRGGLLGKQVRLIHYDDLSKADRSADLYEQLITKDKVDLLLGPYSSGITMKASTVTEAHDFPMVASGASSNKIWSRGYQNIFGTYAPAESFMKPVMEFASSKGLKRVAFTYANTAFPQSVIKGAKEQVHLLDMEIVADESYPKETTEFGTIVEKLKQSTPDVVIGGTYFPDSKALISQARMQDVNAKIFAFTVGPLNPKFGSELGVNADGIMGVSLWEPTLNFPGVKDFTERYETRYGYQPGSHAAGGYGAGMVLESAVKEAKSLDRTQLRSALLNLKTTTTFGHYAVDASGMQVAKGTYVIQWNNGRKTIVLPQQVSETMPSFPFTAWANR